ncbi:MAG TPA: hypothetical protein VG164_01470 [Trebonia sp.]|nr:hypothetical protein [Trebonia sp.]
MPTVTAVVMALPPVVAAVRGGCVRMSRAPLARLTVRSDARLRVRSVPQAAGRARLTGG